MNIVELLNSKGLTISCAESFTGGGFSNYITNIPNASKCFMGGIVCYNAKIKENILGVKKETIEAFGTISKECCEEMVINCHKLFNTDIAISFTGNAGPSASEGKEVGLIYLGFSYKNRTIINEYHLKGTREEVKKQAIDIIIQTIFDFI